MNTWNRTLRVIAAVFSTLVVASAASSAQAAVVLSWSAADIGLGQTANFNGRDPSVIAGLTSNVTYTLSSIGNAGKTWTFSYSVKNNSSSPVTASRVSGFGFNTNPDVVSASATGVYTHTARNGNVPILGTKEVCITGNNCAGGASAGVTKGNTGVGTFSLTFATAPTLLKLSDLYVRYQSINTNRIQGGSAVGEAQTPTAGVPEPATWAMMIAGFGLVGASLRRRRRTAVSA